MRLMVSQLRNLWKESPEMESILRESSSLEEARTGLLNHLNELEWQHLSGKSKIDRLEVANAIEAIRVFKRLLSPANEELVGFSTLEYLWKLARGEDISEATEGFYEEFKHLFRAVIGNADYSKGWLGPALEMEGVEFIDFRKIEGRAAGVARSNYLDKLFATVQKYLDRYASGLDPDVIEERQKNVKAILEFFGASSENWYDWNWQFEHVFRGMRGLEKLKKLVPLSEEEEESVRTAIENDIPWGVTPHFLSLFDFKTSERLGDYQVRSQVMPPRFYVDLMGEHLKDRKRYFDFMGEYDTSPLDLVTRRYSTIAIIKPYDACPQVCVYCQRNWEIEGPLAEGALMPTDKIDAALDWFGGHPSIMDVLITGGDPFCIKDELVKKIMGRLSEFPNIVNIRWGTRIPVTVPMRVTKKLAELIGSYIEPGKRNVAVVTHIESAYEITPELADAVKNLRRQGISCYNQQVYMVETSRRFQTVKNRIAMKKAGVDPYYTFYPKGKEEHKDYLVPVARIAQERKEEARLLPGIFRTDEPVFNVPRLGKNHIRSWQDREIIAITPDGRRIYMWHPWEKGITPSREWMYEDVSILKYLKEMESRGEDISEYKSIWYYY